MEPAYFIAFRDGTRSTAKQYLVENGDSYIFKSSGDVVKFPSLFRAIEFFEERKFETDNVIFAKVNPILGTTWDYNAALAEKRKFFG
ncbi:hypothetical protein AU106_gp027 [Sinorhizobium phage phiM9]|uniref:Uncharacterized protein n=1 Tax=Sinorhizobium phage phiM9 TaxID=1636182 RepID=A0A0F6R7C3_9CAUD|nr:hypothetical protein AU106_gp027 [Sinorhizobium phage phiM9]AKE44658.1 hypothetical protein Sm_phiM9_028 [Sinorhizobium phage phiM9]